MLNELFSHSQRNFSQSPKSAEFGSGSDSTLNYSVRLDPRASDADRFVPTIEDCSLPQWSIPSDLLAVATRIVSDDPETRASSLTAALERKVSQRWQPTERRTAIAFYGESDRFFQLRYTEGSPDGRRYDAIQNAGNRYYFAPIPEQYRIKIAAEWSLNVPLSGSFWDWAKVTPELPLFDTEGPSKALSLIALGYPSIAGYGAFGGVEKSEYQTFKRPIGKRKSGKSGGFTIEKVALPKARLPKDLNEIATPGRRIVLVPDMDSATKTRRSVANAFLHRARLLQQKGCDVRIAYWDSSLGKGIDDVIRLSGEAVARKILDNPLTVTEYSLKIQLSFELATPNAIVNTRDLQIDSPKLPKTGIVYSDSGTGTGKTKLAARETKGRTLLAPYPLRSLAKSAAVGLDANYRNQGKLDRKRGTYSEGDVLSDRLTIVYDSLHKIDLDNQFAGELEDLLLDELTHGLRHMLTGATCKNNRIAIVGKLIEAVKKSKRVIALDADLTCAELDMIRELRPGDTEFYLKNTRKPDPYVTHWLTSPHKQPTIAKAIESIVQLIPQKFAPMGLIHWACDGLATSEKIAEYVGRGQCAVVNSNTIRDKDPLALMAVTGNFDGLETKGIRYIVTSPSIVQGVSWEDPGRFAGVIGTFTGCSITPRQMRQALTRVRETIPRIVWAAPHRQAPGKWGNESDPRIVKNRILQQGKFNTMAIGEDFALSDSQSMAVDWAARLIAADNLWLSTPAASLKVLLEDHGHVISPVCVDADGKAFRTTAEQWQAEQDTTLLDSEILSQVEADSLKVKAEFDRLSPEERKSLARFEICSFYGIEPESLTLGLIERDRDRLRSKVLKFEHLTLEDGEAMAVAAVKASSQLAAIDSDRALAELRVRQAIGINELIEILKDRPLTKDSPEMVDFKARCLTHLKSIKDALNYSVKDSASPIKILGELLAQIGVKIKSTRHRSADGLVRLYSLDLEEWELLQSIVANRIVARDSEVSIPDPHHLITIQGGVDQQENPEYSGESEGFEGESFYLEYTPSPEEMAEWEVFA